MIGSPDKSTSFRIDVAVVEDDANKWKEVEDYTGNIGNDGEFTFEYEDPTTGGNLEYRVFTSVGRILLPSNDNASGWLPRTKCRTPGRWRT